MFFLMTYLASDNKPCTTWGRDMTMDEMGKFDRVMTRVCRFLRLIK